MNKHFQQNISNDIESERKIIMKTIMITKLDSTSTTHIDGTVAEYQWIDKNEAEMCREWNGDVNGYASNYIDVCRDINGVELHIVDGITIHNEPADAVVLADKDGTPFEMLWSEEVNDDE